MDKPRVTVETVTPAIAAEWLTKNVHNRPVKPTALQRLVDDANEGKFRFTGDPIQFSDDDVLLNGQHRLHMVVMTGMTFDFVVVRGLPAETQEDIDRVVPRSLADILALRGEVNSGDLAAALVRLTQYELNPTDSRLNLSPRIHQSLESLERHPGIRDSLMPAQRAQRNTGLRRSQGIALHYVLASIDPEDANDFFDKLCTGADLAVDSPIRALRQWLIDQRQLTVGRRARASRIYEWVVCIKAWNAYREGRPLSRLGWRPGGANPETVPVPA